jgi:phage gpG-like protein
VVREFKVDLTDVEKGLRSLAKTGGDVAETLKLLTKPLRDDQREHGRQMIGPGGEKWKPRAASTVLRARVAKGKKRIKGANRKLLNSLPNRTVQIRQSGDSLIAYSKVPWAGIHQHGGTAGRGAKIPARPFLWFSFEFLSLARRLVIKRLMHAWNS